MIEGYCIDIDGNLGNFEGTNFGCDGSCNPKYQLDDLGNCCIESSMNNSYPDIDNTNSCWDVDNHINMTDYNGDITGTSCINAGYTWTGTGERGYCADWNTSILYPKSDGYCSTYGSAIEDGNLLDSADDCHQHSGECLSETPNVTDCINNTLYEDCVSDSDNLCVWVPQYNWVTGCNDTDGVGAGSWVYTNAIKVCPSVEHGPFLYGGGSKYNCTTDTVSGSVQSIDTDGCDEWNTEPGFLEISLF